MTLLPMSVGAGFDVAEPECISGGSGRWAFFDRRQMALKFRNLRPQVLGPFLACQKRVVHGLSGSPGERMVTHSEKVESQLRPTHQVH